MAPQKKKRVIAEVVDSSDEEGDTPVATNAKKTDDFKSNKPLVLLNDEQKSDMRAIAEAAKEAAKPVLTKNQQKKASKKAKKTAAEATVPGVIYLSRIPHGFYEEEMQAYFSQFGEVTRLRLSRNKKTGASKHYAFIEFAAEEAAKIAAETMDNYLLSNHILKCKFVEAEKLHPDLWKGANKKFKVLPYIKIERTKHNKPKTHEQHEKLVQKIQSAQQKKAEQLKALGIDYELPTLHSASPANESVEKEPIATPAADSVEAVQKKALVRKASRKGAKAAKTAGEQAPSQEVAVQESD
ncbi:MKI67 FHA domain-interacting nucleolar phosphoprotein [Geranomyces michiganensis]|nr:MKI67 FHA domain-interacting nucleolar phosphoprotein [Geranomyces michiganensis]